MNTKLEKKHETIVIDLFKNNLLTINFESCDTVKVFKEKFDKTMLAHETKNPDYKVTKDHLDSEMAKFTGKVVFDKNEGETASTMSGLTK